MILHMQLASLLQDQNRHGRKLLGERTNVKLGVRCVGYMIIPICHAIALAEKRSVILRDQNRTTEALTSDLARQKLIHLRGNHWLLQLRTLLRDKQGLLQLRKLLKCSCWLLPTSSPLIGNATACEQKRKQ